MGVEDLGNTEILIVAGGTLTASTLITLLLQMVKDYFPGLSGRRAVSSVYGVSAVVSLVTLMVNGDNPLDPLTWVSWFVMTLLFSNVARGIYATMFRPIGDLKATEKLHE